MKALIFVLFFAVFPITAYAGEFDPNFIIEDHDLTAHISMSQQDIREFLIAQGGQIGNQFFRDVDGLQKTAAEIIYNASVIYQINPRVLLVLLQKEQSLVTDPSPTIGQLNWAMGYAACDSCDVSKPEIAKHAGFAKQVDSAAGAFRYYINNRLSQSWIKRAGTTYDIDGVAVTPANHATGYFYTYTPHILGNKNFWTLWQAWFDKTFPDGLVIKAHNSPDIWYLQNGKRRHVTSMNVLRSYFNESDIRRVDAADIAQLSIGEPLKFPNYSLLSVDGRVFLLVNDELLQFASNQAIRDLGFNPLEIIVATREDVASYKLGTMLTSASVYPTGALLKARTSGELYFVKNGQKHAVLSDELLVTNFRNDPPIMVNDNGLMDFIEGPAVLFEDGTVIGVSDTQDIYLISNGERRKIPDDQTLANVGFSHSDIHWVDESMLNIHPLGLPL